MLVKMKKALKNLATAHFTKNMSKSEKYANSHFSHFSFSVQDTLFDFPLWQFEVLFASPFGIETYAKFSVPFNTASIVEESGPKMVFFGLGPTLNTLSSTKVGQIHLKLILTYTQLPNPLQQSILASLKFGL